MDSKITIADVARQCGVAKSTVSYAFNGKREISEAMRKKIFDVAEKLNYKPSAIAKIMNTKRTMQIGLAIDQCATSSTEELVDSFGAALSKRSYTMVISISNMNPDLGRKILSRFSNGMVDGVVNFLPPVSAEEAKKLCAPVPVVTFLRQDFAPIRIDYFNGTLKALQHLWALGHRSIGIIADGPKVWITEHPALTAYKKFMTERDAYNPKIVSHEIDLIGIQAGLDIAPMLWQNGATAIIAGEMTAIGVYQWANNNVRIPQDLSIVSFDDSRLCLAMSPALTAMHVDMNLVAEHTVASLVSLIEEDGILSARTEAAIVPQTLVLRRSTAAPSFSRLENALSPCN